MGVFIRLINLKVTLVYLVKHSFVDAEKRVQVSYVILNKSYLNLKKRSKLFRICI